MRSKFVQFIVSLTLTTPLCNARSLAIENKKSVVKKRDLRLITTIFRVVEAKPDDFIYSLKNVDRSQTQSQSSSSRLEQYFRLTDKTVQNGEIKIKLRLQMRYLPDALRKYSTLDLFLKELTQTNSNLKSPQFSVNFALSPSAQINGLLTVKPHQRGSQLRLDVQDSTLPDWLVEKLITLTLDLNLATKAPQ